MPYCPMCGDEFVQSVSSCPDCGVPLTAEAPGGWDDDPSRPTAQWEIVLATGDPARLAAVKSLLHGAGIPFVVTGELLQSLEGMGVMGVGYNVIFGPARVQVPADRASEARELISVEGEPAGDLDALTSAAVGTAEAAPVDPVGGSGGRRGCGLSLGAGVGLVIGILAGLAIVASGVLDAEDGERISGVVPQDQDGDGRADRWSRYEDGALLAEWADRNHDGEPDIWNELDRQSRSTSLRFDQNFDGEPDSFTLYEDGRAVAIEEDGDYDGEIDRWIELDEHELPEAHEEDEDGDGRIDLWVEYDEGAVVAERVDQDRDGIPDERYEYEAGTLVSGQRDTDHDGTMDVSITYRNGNRETMSWEARPDAPARKLTYVSGSLREELRDRDGDGAWDLRVTYDSFEYPREEVELP